jgi:Peptidase family M48
MTKRKNLKLYILLALATGLGYIVFNNSQKLTQQLTTHSTAAQTVSAKDLFTAELQKEEQAVWSQLKSIGVTPEHFVQEKKRLRSQYLRSDVPFTTKAVSAKTKEFVQGILKECGINPSTITVVGYNDGSPAAATERVIYVNENVFWNLSPAARKFVVGHEIQHIVHGDNSARYTLETILNADTEALAKKHRKPDGHALLYYSRFKERRADVTTALKGPEWAEGYLTFAQEQLKKGDTPGVTHPKYSARVELAQRIVDHIKNEHTTGVILA